MPDFLENIVKVTDKVSLTTPIISCSWLVFLDQLVQQDLKPVLTVNDDSFSCFS